MSGVRPPAGFLRDHGRHVLNTRILLHAQAADRTFSPVGGAFLPGAGEPFGRYPHTIRPKLRNAPAKPWSSTEVVT